MNREAETDPLLVPRLDGGYPRWMRGLAEPRMVRSSAPPLEKWVKILHCLRGVHGESAWRDVFAAKGIVMDPSVVESDLEAVDDFIEWHPKLGTMGDKAWGLFAAAIRECALDTSCFVWMETYRMHPPQEVCWRTTLDQVPKVVDVPENYYGGGPHAVWAADESWFVVSDVDLPYSIVSCSDKLCQRLVSEIELQAYEVDGDWPLS